MKKFHILLRFADHCQHPKAVAGRPCWTTDSTQLRENSSLKPPELEILVAYRTTDGRLRESFVAVRNLRTTTPKLKQPAFIIKPLTCMKVVIVTGFEKDTVNGKKITAVHVKNLSGSIPRSGARTFKIEAVTRVLPYDQGPP